MFTSTLKSNNINSNINNDLKEMQSLPKYDEDDKARKFADVLIPVAFTSVAFFAVDTLKSCGQNVHKTESVQDISNSAKSDRFIFQDFDITCD